MEETIEFFSKYKEVSIILHVLSVIAGMGSAIVSDILFNTYIKDKKIHPDENRTLSVLSNVIWISLIFIVLSGFAIFASDPNKYLNSVKFLTKMSVVGFIILNGYCFQRFIHPSLRKIDFKDQNLHHKYVRIRKLSFAFGSISLSSWLIAFLLAMLDSIPVSYPIAMLLYLAFCIFAVLMSQILDKIITRK